MKKFAIKSIAIAASALCAGGAWASVNLDAVPQAPTAFASELNYTAVAPSVGITGALVVTTKLGFGVSAAQDRYVRIDLTGAKLAVASAAPNAPVGAPAFANSVLVQGGAIGETYAIYQITAAAGGSTAGDVVTITLPNLAVPAGNAAPVNVTYTLYETATAAVANAPGTNLYQNAGSVAVFKKALQFKLTPGENTAIVAEAYKKFTGASVGPVTIGSFDYGVTAGVAGANGAPVALAALVTPPSTATFTGDFGATAAAGVYVDAPGCAGPGLPVVLNLAKTSGTLALGGALAADLCYKVTGTKVLPIQTIKAALAVTPAAGSNAASVDAAAIGSILHDGTELQWPIVQQPGGWLPRIVLTNTGGSDAPFEANTTAAPGSSITANASIKGTIPAGGQVIIEGAAMPQFAGGAGRGFTVVNVAAPNTTIQGAFSLANPITGAVTNNGMIRPGTN